MYNERAGHEIGHAFVDIYLYEFFSYFGMRNLVLKFIK